MIIRTHGALSDTTIQILPIFFDRTKRLQAETIEAKNC
jgi:hypothetical protein